MDDDFSNLALLYGAIREVVGEDGIPKLQEMFGGAGIHVPGRRVTERTVLTQAFGLDLASRPCGRFQPGSDLTDSQVV